MLNDRGGEKFFGKWFRKLDLSFEIYADMTEPEEVKTYLSILSAINLERHIAYAVAYSVRGLLQQFWKTIWKFSKCCSRKIKLQPKLREQEDNGCCFKIIYLSCMKIRQGKR